MKSIRWRLVAMYVLIVIAVMIINGTLIIFILKDSEYKQLDNEIKSSVEFVAVVDNNELMKDYEEVKNLLIEKIEGKNRIDVTKRITLLDSEGVQIYPLDGEEGERFSSQPAVRVAMEGEFSDELTQTYLTDKDGNRVLYREYAYPISKDDKVAFIVYGRMSTVSVAKRLQYTTFIISISILIALIMAVILGIILSTTLTKPITVLTMKAREMAMGNLDTVIEVLSDDEIGQLTQNFNLMAEALNKTLSEMTSEKNKLETVFSHMTDGILVFNEEGLLIHYNLAAQKLLSLKKIDKKFDSMFKSYLDINYESLIKNVQKDIVQYIIDVNSMYLNVCFAPYQVLEKENIGIICVLQDITKHKKLEMMQKDFVANVSHELRTPITTIKSYTETLLDGAMEDLDTSKEFLNVINNESDRMTNLVQDLLDLSRLDNRQTQFKMQQMDLTHIVEESVSRYKIHAVKKKQKMTFYHPNKNFIICGDPNRIEQVVKNIISNAVKYSYENASIDIYMPETEDNIVVAVQDTGMGIPEEDAARIFERFYRVDKARSRAMGGTGLGLAIAKEIMEYHGGTIKVKSELGKGTCFYLIFCKPK